MSNIIDLNADHPLVGTWKCGDGFSDVEITIKPAGHLPCVAIIDTFDGEVPEIYDVTWDPEQDRLSFSTLWSSGRFVKYRFSPLPAKGRASVVFSYVESEVWERKADLPFANQQ